MFHGCTCINGKLPWLSGSPAIVKETTQMISVMPSVTFVEICTPTVPTEVIPVSAHTTLVVLGVSQAVETEASVGTRSSGVLVSPLKLILYMILSAMSADLPRSAICWRSPDATSTEGATYGSAGGMSSIASTA
jgi:hypothetical protein